MGNECLIIIFLSCFRPLSFEAFAHCINQNWLTELKTTQLYCSLGHNIKFTRRHKDGFEILIQRARNPVILSQHQRQQA